MITHIRYTTKSMIDEIYKNIVESCVEQKVNVEIPNHDYETASFIYKTMFTNCTEEICIFARGVKKEILDKDCVISAAKKFLDKKNTKIKIIYRYKDQEDKEKNENSTFIQELKKHSPSKLYITPSNGGTEWNENQASFSIGDNRMYRIRRDCPAKAVEGEAWVNFGNEKKTQDLKNKFETYLNQINHS